MRVIITTFSIAAVLAAADPELVRHALALLGDVVGLLLVPGERHDQPPLLLVALGRLGALDERLAAPVASGFQLARGKAVAQDARAQQLDHRRIGHGETVLAPVRLDDRDHQIAAVARGVEVIDLECAG